MFILAINCLYRYVLFEDASGLALAWPATWYDMMVVHHWPCPGLVEFSLHLLKLISLERQLMKLLGNMYNMAKDSGCLVGSCRMSVDQQNLTITNSTQMRSKDEHRQNRLWTNRLSPSHKALSNRLRMHMAMIFDDISSVLPGYSHNTTNNAEGLSSHTGGEGNAGA